MLLGCFRRKPGLSGGRSGTVVCGKAQNSFRWWEWEKGEVLPVLTSNTVKSL